jgi:hypothetical protein
LPRTCWCGCNRPGVGSLFAEQGSDPGSYHAAAGALLLLLTMHLARGIGKLHGLIAKNLLVRL